MPWVQPIVWEESSGYGVDMVQSRVLRTMHLVKLLGNTVLRGMPLPDMDGSRFSMGMHLVGARGIICLHQTLQDMHLVACRTPLYTFLRVMGFVAGQTQVDRRFICQIEVLNRLYRMTICCLGTSHTVNEEGRTVIEEEEDEEAPQLQQRAATSSGERNRTLS